MEMTLMVITFQNHHKTQFDLNVAQLPANRPETKTFGITDPLPAGAKFNKKATEVLETIRIGI